MTLRNPIFLFAFGVFLTMQSVVATAQDSAAMQELYQKIEAMGREIDQLRGDNEKLNYQVEQLKLNQKKGFMAIDERLANTNKKPTQPFPAKPVQPSAVKPAPTAKPAQAPATKPAPAPMPTKPVAASKPAPQNEKAAYNAAYETLKGNRNAGVGAFTKFLQTYPNSTLAENAHYWIGEAKYAQKDYKGAIDSFVVVLNKYKSGRKAADAAVKLGYSFYELKDWTLARRTFNDVLRYFPGSNAAKLATARLDRMQKEGH